MVLWGSNSLKSRVGDAITAWVGGSLAQLNPLLVTNSCRKFELQAACPRSATAQQCGDGRAWHSKRCGAAGPKERLLFVVSVGFCACTVVAAAHNDIHHHITAGGMLMSTMSVSPGASISLLSAGDASCPCEFSPWSVVHTF
jgi:hypothetical protein